MLAHRPSSIPINASTCILAFGFATNASPTKTARRHARVPSTAKRNVGCKDDPELSIKSNGPGEESACLDDGPSFMSAGISLRWKAVKRRSTRVALEEWRSSIVYNICT